MQLSEFIRNKLAVEEYSFTVEELQTATKKEREALKTDLSYWSKKGDILSLRKGFYLILPPRYSKIGKLPVELYVEKLFQNLDRPYYLAMFSAAKYYGASHQQIHKDYLVTTGGTLSSIQKGNYDLQFFTTTTWPIKNIREKRGEAGIFKISDPALTAADLIHFQNKLGGLNRILSVLEELLEEITFSNLSDLLAWYPHKSTLQRLGYFIDGSESENRDELTQLLVEYFDAIKYYPVLLSPTSNEKAGAVDNFWKVAINVELESDL